MLIIFRSQAAGDVMMFGDVAYKLMEIMGKEPAGRGIITVDQLPAALGRLRAAALADKVRHAEVREDDLPEHETTDGGGQRPYVSLARRAVPLIELLEWSMKKDVPVVWGP